ncbi:MAG: VWA domain-containing protein [Candidatus Eisenbacteria bacterium]|nr:VWA domain-containing protein [Candidatus Eisenbacteria bacterium]
MSFEHPAWLWGLAALPLLALLEWRALERARRAARSLVGSRPDHALLAQSLPGVRIAGLALRLAALAMLVAGAAGPQWGRETVRRQSQGSDLVFVLDVSASMDARDVAPSRLDEARREALGLLERVPGSRVGVVAFAGDAVRLCPLTLDHAAVRLVLASLSSSSVSTPGTDLGRALKAMLKLLPQGRREEQAAVVWTDGEDLEGGAREAIEDVRRAGVRVFAVGVGTPAGDVVPVFDGSDQAVDVKRDENGQVVRSRLDERLLRDLGRSTRGGYFAASRSGGELSRLAASMGSLARSSHGARLVERPVARFPLLALLAVAALAWELARPRRREARPRNQALARAAALLLVAGAMASPAHAQSPWARGDRAFQRGLWAKAESLYAKRALRSAPARLQVNLATARALNGKREAAEKALDRLTAERGRAGQVAGYNLGTLYGEQKDYDRALGELRRALERDPGDADARWNYELLRRERDAAREPSSPRQPDAPPTPDQKGKPNPGGPNPEQQGARPSPNAPPQAQGAPPPPAPGGGAPGMTKQQAEQLLGSLQELERLERQRAQRVRATREKKGRDW